MEKETVKYYGYYHNEKLLVAAMVSTIEVLTVTDTLISSQKVLNSTCHKDDKDFIEITESQFMEFAKKTNEFLTKKINE